MTVTSHLFHWHLHYRIHLISISSSSSSFIAHLYLFVFNLNWSINLTINDHIKKAIKNNVGRWKNKWIWFDFENKKFFNEIPDCFRRKIVVSMSVWIFILIEIQRDKKCLTEPLMRFLINIAHENYFHSFFVIFLKFIFWVKKIPSICFLSFISAAVMICTYLILSKRTENEKKGNEEKINKLNQKFFCWPVSLFCTEIPMFVFLALEYQWRWFRWKNNYIRKS